MRPDLADAGPRRGPPQGQAAGIRLRERMARSVGGGGYRTRIVNYPRPKRFQADRSHGLEREIRSGYISPRTIRIPHNRRTPSQRVAAIHRLSPPPLPHVVIASTAPVRPVTSDAGSGVWTVGPGSGGGASAHPARWWSVANGSGNDLGRRGHSDTRRKVGEADGWGDEGRGERGRPDKAVTGHVGLLIAPPIRSALPCRGPHFFVRVPASDAPIARTPEELLKPSGLARRTYRMRGRRRPRGPRVRRASPLYRSSHRTPGRWGRRKIGPVTDRLGSAPRIAGGPGLAGRWTGATARRAGQ